MTNKLGPVRAIRSYVGANSGPSTQRTHVFYDRREDIRTDLRVHSIGSIVDFMDYSSVAIGMTYRNDFNQVGTLSTTWTPASVIPYYLDASTPSTPQCTGDGAAYGSSGVNINSMLPSTDPAIGGTDHLASTRTMYFESPGGSAADGIARRNQVVFPLSTTVTPAP